MWGQDGNDERQAVKGDWNYSMSPVYMVSIMDFELIHDVRNIEVNEISGTDKWMYVLKNLARLTDRPAGLQERIFIKLFEAAEIAAFSPEERKQYEHDMMTENDYRNTIEFAKDKAREEGMRRGLDEGMQRGLNEGMQRGLMTAAAGMKKMGMETDAIARATGLSREAVEQL